MGYTEIHSHFVYGVDDGADTREEMFGMLDEAHQSGITALYATPHCVPGMEPFPEAIFREHLDEARAYCLHKGYALTLMSGAELLYTPQLHFYIKDHPLPTLEGSNRVLLEFAPGIAAADIRRAVELLLQHGYTPVLAHIERYHCLFSGGLCEKLKRMYPVEYQVNARTVVSCPLPLLKRMTVSGWFRKGLIDYVASDAHNTTTRPFLTHQAHSSLTERVDKRYADRLVGFGP